MNVIECIQNLKNLNTYLAQFHHNHHSAHFEEISWFSLSHILEIPRYDANHVGNIPSQHYIKWFGKSTRIEKSPEGNSDIHGKCCNFVFTAESTMKTGANQCSQEYGASIRHFKTFITSNGINPREGYILFITPELNEDTYNTAKNACRDSHCDNYQLVPIEVPTLISILHTKSIVFTLMNVDFRIFFNQIITELHQSTSLGNFRIRVKKIIVEWKKEVINYEKNACLGLLVYEFMKQERHPIEITDIETQMKHKQKIKQFLKLSECEINDKILLSALTTNGFARVRGISTGNVELVEFVPHADVIRRYELYTQKLESVV